MLKKYQLAISNINDRKYLDIIFIIILILLMVIGFLSPKIFKLHSPVFNFLLVKRDLSKISISIDKLDKFKINKNYLSSEQINKKDIVLEWSNRLIYNVENDIAIARMYFPYIPKNINEFETH